MTPNRVATCVLTLVLLALLGWSIVAGVGDVRTRVLLGVGAALGGLHTALGRLPDWITDHSCGSLSEDDDPSNISARVYLPILLGAVVVAGLVVYFGLRFL